ncbi:MAG: Wzt carbohydrate-binding domain-containing protein, partial [Acidimicrobiia bacterium]
PGDTGARWGSGEIKVTHAEVLDEHGRADAALHTGEPVVFRVHYEASETIEQPVFGLAIHRLDGAEVTGPNTREAEVVPDKIEGRGHVDLRVDRLMLAPGTFDLTTSIYNYTLSHPYDYWQRCVRFDVEVGDPVAEFGVMTLGGTWVVPGAER